MIGADQLKQLMLQAMGLHGKDIIEIFICNVTAVNEQECTCDCETIGGDAPISIPGVQLMAELNDGLLYVPDINSTVVIALSTRNKAFVILFSAFQKVLWVIKNGSSYTTLEMSAGLTKLNDGSFGGLTKTQELKAQLDAMNAQVQAIITSLTNWTPVANDGGAALKTYFGTEIAGKPAGDFTNIENTIITHGV